eukprot:5119244-Amphidinium_carterae.1
MLAADGMVTIISQTARFQPEAPWGISMIMAMVWGIDLPQIQYKFLTCFGEFSCHTKNIVDECAWLYLDFFFKSKNMVLAK